MVARSISNTQQTPPGEWQMHKEETKDKIVHAASFILQSAVHPASASDEYALDARVHLHAEQNKPTSLPVTALLTTNGASGAEMHLDVAV
jgi:hypothetical protein